MNNNNLNNHDKINYLIKVLMQLRLDTKLYHWQTTLFNKHKISDELLSDIDEISDKIVEVSLGKYNIRPIISDEIIMRNISDDFFINIIKENISILEKNILNDIKYISFKSLIDELLVLLNKTLYLLSFN